MRNRNPRMLVLGTLLAAMAVTGLHPAAAAEATTHWELYAFVDVDGDRKGSKRINDKEYTDPLSCVQDAVKLDPPPPAKEANGHTFVFGYVCAKVAADGTPMPKPGPTGTTTI